MAIIVTYRRTSSYTTPRNNLYVSIAKNIHTKSCEA